VAVVLGAVLLDPLIRLQVLAVDPVVLLAVVV